MAFLSQEIVEYLNEASDRRGLGEWLEANPVIHNFVTCPYISIRPTALPDARRITAFDGQQGRFVDILYRAGNHRYMINIAAWGLTVEEVETLILSIEDISGSCHVERTYLILEIPAGYCLDIVGDVAARRLHLRELAEDDDDI